jgi:hypothetical protein
MLRLIHQLPQASRFNAKVANDPEHVEAIIKAQKGQREKYSPPLAEWGSEHEMLASISDGIGFLTAITVAANGGRPEKPHTTPRPKTAFGDIEQKIRMQEHESLVARVLKARPPVDSSPED